MTRDLAAVSPAIPGGPEAASGPAVARSAGMPDFIVVGAMKCGTSTLQSQLAAQPGIFMTTPKEPNYFSDDAVFARGPAWYGALFAGANPGDLKGEASTHYTKLPTHPLTLARLTAAMPAPRIVYLIRDPVARAVSHYIHEWTMGEMSGDIEAAFDRHPELVDYGCYARQIAPWVEAFGREAVFLSSLEAMTADPQGLLTRVGAFLGHEGPLLWREERAQVNVSAERVRRLPLQGLLVDNPVATALRRALVPKALRDRIRRSRQMEDRPALTPALTARLEARFAEDHRDLVALFPDRPETRADIAMAYPFVPR